MEKMKNSLFRKALTTLLVLTFLCSIFVAFNYFTVREKIFAETITVGSLEQGDVVEQANYCTTFGGKVAVTNTLSSAGDPGNGKNYALNGANAIKFNVKLNSANTWNHYYTLFTPKSNSAYLAIGAALEASAEDKTAPVPLHLRNAPTQLMEQLGYHEGYKYPHDYPGHYVDQQYLPDALVGTEFWKPQPNPAEEKLGRIPKKMK